MKVNRLETHDRLEHFTKQEFSIGECCQDLINQRPFGYHSFYIFAHTRTDDDGVTKRLIWQPRLTKPKAETNSMLFKAYPGTDGIKVIWVLPPSELKDSYDKGKITENITVRESIDKYMHHRSKLEEKEDDDLDDKAIQSIYMSIARDARMKRASKNAMQATSAESLILRV